MLLIIDNYDSFTYNLYHAAGAIMQDIMVVYNDCIGLDDVEDLRPTHIIISPGPGRPCDAGMCEEIILSFAGKIPILGVCLGHQAICEAYGGVVTYAKALTHGKASTVHIANGNPIFRGIPPMLHAGRYHSLAADRAALPEELLVIAETDDGEVMGVKHRDFDLYGLQFHPESILTPKGGIIIENFLGIGGSLT